MTPAELRELDLAVDAAMGCDTRTLLQCEKCKSTYSVRTRELSVFPGGAPGGMANNWVCGDERCRSAMLIREPLPSRRWSTDEAAVGAMMAWLGPKLWGMPNSDELEVMFEDGQWFVSSLYHDDIARSESLPHALSLAVVEVARRAK